MSAAFSVDAATWTLVQIAIVPLVVGLLTKASASNRLKVFANLALSAVGTLLALVTEVNGVAVVSRQALVLWAVGVLGAVASHYGIWRPLGVTGSAPTTNVLSPSRGLGSDSSDPSGGANG